MKINRRSAALIGFALALGVSVAAQTPPPQKPTPTPSPTSKPAPTLTGVWPVELVTDAFTATPTLEFKQDGDKITGTYEGRYGKFPFTATLKVRALEFAFTMSAEGSDVRMSFKGEVAADFQSIKGTATLEGLGDATWSATKKKSQ